MRGCNVFVFLLLVLLSELCAGLYFLVGKERKCFTIEQPKETPMVITYSVVDDTDLPDGEVNLSLHYGILGSPDLMIQERSFTKVGGHIDYTTDNDGYYCICLVSENTTPSRVKLTVIYGYDSDYYEKLAKEEKFDDINLEVHILNDQMDFILREADFQKHKEVDFHARTESLNGGSMWWPVMQVGILIVTGIFQAHHLKNFFKSNNLI